MLGNPELSEHDVADARDILTVCGAMTLVEEEITKLTERSAAVAGLLVGLGSRTPSPPISTGSPSAWRRGPRRA
ncbi:hypothetical protein [Nesterenkonia pannonica]|uniref:hypothetical protein n=1 Tax=Nesterenkonia pannonica TaxID=1548602 RepID=UPI002164AEE5|nr:hypothetical protein [Nesterenkonia pannonica]